MTQEEYNDLVSALHTIAEDKESLELQRKSEGQAHYDAYKAVNDKYRTDLGDLDSLNEETRKAIVETKEAYDRAVAEAIKNGLPVPEPLEDPKGLSFKRELKVVVRGSILDVPARYLKWTLDDEAIAEAISAGIEEIPGLGIELTRKVLYRRPDLS